MNVWGGEKDTAKEVNKMMKTLPKPSFCLYNLHIGAILLEY